MELYKGHLEKSFKKKLEESGVNFTTENKNRQLSQEEINERKKKAKEKSQ